MFLKLKPDISKTIKFVHPLKIFVILFTAVVKLLRLTDDNSEQLLNIEAILINFGAFILDKSIVFKELP